MATLFALLAALAAFDLATDLRGASSALHVLVEGAVLAIALAASIWFALRVRRLAHHARELREHATELAAHLATTRAQAERWRTDAAALIAGLGAAIDEQLARWGLSPAEAEIALLLLKGLSHKEIAQMRGVAETTVRQQSRTLYRKAGLAGRNELAAFFLEDLLAPRPTEG